MKRFFMLLTALLVSTVCFAQSRISISDACYYDNYIGAMQTYDLNATVRRLANKGFSVINREYAYGEGAGGNNMRFTYITMYQRSTNTKVEVSDYGIESITFGSTNSLYEFINEAVYSGYVKKSGSIYVMTKTVDFGIESFELRGRMIVFTISVP